MKPLVLFEGILNFQIIFQGSKNLQNGESTRIWKKNDWPKNSLASQHNLLYFPPFVWSNHIKQKEENNESLELPERNEFLSFLIIQIPRKIEPDLQDTKRAMIKIELLVCWWARFFMENLKIMYEWVPNCLGNSNSV